MLAMHCWISEGQSMCDEWGSARIHQQGKIFIKTFKLLNSVLKESLFQTLFQSTTEKKQPKQGEGDKT